MNFMQKGSGVKGKGFFCSGVVVAILSGVRNFVNYVCDKRGSGLLVGVVSLGEKHLVPITLDLGVSDKILDSVAKN